VGDWDLWIQSLPDGQREGVREVYSRLLGQDLSQYDPAFFSERVIDELKRTATKTAIARLNSVSDPQPETLQTLADQIDLIQAGQIQGLARLHDVDIWFNPSRPENLLPTGYPSLDSIIGGLGEELWIVFADSGVGKSMLLQNLMANSAQKGKRVLHVTLELGLRPQIQRYYRQIARMSRADFVTKEDAARDRLQHWMRLAGGEIYLLEYPAYSLDPQTLLRTIERISRTIGEIDLLGLDYLDLLTLPRGVRSEGRYEDLGKITHQTRAISTTFGIPTLTASQAVRRPEKKNRLSVRDMGDSYNKIRGADGILSLVQTEEEREVHQGRLGILKVRDSGGWGREVPLYINRELALIQELDHPNTVKLMRELGHLQEAPAKGGLSLVQD